MRQISVPGGEERMKGSSLIVVVLVTEAITVVILNKDRESRRYVKYDELNNREAMAGTYTQCRATWRSRRVSNTDEGRKYQQTVVRSIPEDEGGDL